MTHIEKIIRNALRFQEWAAERISPERRKEGEGRTGKLIVDDPTGKEHTLMYFKVENQRLHIVDQKVPVRNEIILLGTPYTNYTGVDLFIDLLRGKLPIRKAYTEDWLVVTGDVASYDSEEMIQVVEDFIDRVARHLGFREDYAGENKRIGQEL